MKPLRMRGQDSVFNRPKQSKTLHKNIKSISTVQLPSIYSRSLKMKRPQISLQKPNEVRKQLCTVVTFKKNKLSCIMPDMYEKLPEQIKAISFQTDAYRHRLSLVNKIFGSCELFLKQKDILVAEGQRSQAHYIFITNFAYHPQSLCCRESIIIKCSDKQGIQNQGSKAVTKCHILCMGCQKILLKFVQKQEIEVQDTHDKKKKLLDFALHIASGRYKKHRMDEDPINQSLEYMHSRIYNLKVKRNQPTESLQ